MNTRAALHRSIGRSGFFALAFGAIVGSGWVVILGEWLKVAGPGGSSLGFLVGGCVMMIVGLCYGELASRSSIAGGEFLYTLQTFGPLPAFLVGWFLTLFAVSVCGFEAIALAWMLKALVPRMQLSTAYFVGGSPVTFDALAVGIGAAIVVGTLHFRGATSAIRFQNIVTYGFIAVSSLLVCCGLSFGSIANLQPLFVASKDHSWVAGTLWIFATSAFFLNGWQASLHAIEERRPDVSTRIAVLSMVAAIGISALFYIAVIFAASMATPWSRLVNEEMPAAAAFRVLGGGGILGTLVLVAAVASLAKTWSAMAWVATRLLVAQGRYGFLPCSMALLHAQSGSPRNAVLVVTTLTVVEIAMGRSALLPIVDMLSICSALSVVLCLAMLLRRRYLGIGRSSFLVPGGILTILCGLIGATAMIGGALMQPFLTGHGRVPVEWILLFAWGGVGLIVWFSTRHLRVLRDWQADTPLK